MLLLLFTLKRGPLRIFYTIYQFDPSAAADPDSAPPDMTSVTAAEQKNKTGSSFEICESVTVTELVKNPATSVTAAYQSSVTGSEGVAAEASEKSVADCVNKTIDNSKLSETAASAGVDLRCFTATGTVSAHQQEEPMEITKSYGGDRAKQHESTSHSRSDSRNMQIEQEHSNQLTDTTG